MNVHLREVILTSRDGDKFFRMAEVYVRGNTVKYLRVPDEAMAKVSAEDQRKGEPAPLPPARGRSGPAGRPERRTPCP